MLSKNIFLEVEVSGPGLYEITDEVVQSLDPLEIGSGLLTLFIRHTSASLIIQENADPDVQTDLINYFNKLAPMDNSLYAHTTEGKDDMPAHIKSSLTNNQITLSIKNGGLILGAWQGIYLFEHRLAPQLRKILFHFLGD